MATTIEELQKKLNSNIYTPKTDEYTPKTDEQIRPEAQNKYKGTYEQNRLNAQQACDMTAQQLRNQPATLGTAYEQQAETAKGATAASISAADRNSISRGMQRSSYNAATLANLQNQGNETIADIMEDRTAAEAALAEQQTLAAQQLQQLAQLDSSCASDVQAAIDTLKEQEYARQIESEQYVNNLLMQLYEMEENSRANDLALKLQEEQLKAAQRQNSTSSGGGSSSGSAGKTSASTATVSTQPANNTEALLEKLSGLNSNSGLLTNLANGIKSLALCREQGFSYHLQQQAPVDREFQEGQGCKEGVLMAVKSSAASQIEKVKAQVPNKLMSAKTISKPSMDTSAVKELAAARSLATRSSEGQLEAGTGDIVKTMFARARAYSSAPDALKPLVEKGFISVYNAYTSGRNDPNSALYNPYSSATNYKAIEGLAQYGYDVTQMSDDEVRSLLKGKRTTATGYSAAAPMKTSTAAENAAYWAQEYLDASGKTAAAENELAQMQRAVDYYANTLGLSDAEIVKRINASGDYPTLKKMQEDKAAGSATLLNRAVDYTGDDTIYGMIFSARNGGESLGNYELNAGAYAAGFGALYEPDETAAARRNGYVQPLRQHDYAGRPRPEVWRGTFDRNWLEQNRVMLNKKRRTITGRSRPPSKTAKMPKRS